MDTDNDGVPDAIDCDPLDSKKDKVLVCHNGNTICISQNALQSNLDNGDQLGACPAPSEANQAVSPMVQDQGLIAADLKFSVFPNPSKGQFNIQLTTSKAGKAEVFIFDAKGTLMERRLVQLTGTGQTFSFALKNKKSGIYVVKVVSDGVVQTTQLAVQ
jgi:hypothetical protein